MSLNLLNGTCWGNEPVEQNQIASSTAFNYATSAVDNISQNLGRFNPKKISGELILEHTKYYRIAIKCDIRSKSESSSSTMKLSVTDTKQFLYSCLELEQSKIFLSLPSYTVILKYMMTVQQENWNLKIFVPSLESKESITAKEEQNFISLIDYLSFMIDQSTYKDIYKNCGGGKVKDGTLRTSEIELLSPSKNGVKIRISFTPEEQRSPYYQNEKIKSPKDHLKYTSKEKGAGIIATWSQADCIFRSLGALPAFPKADKYTQIVRFYRDIYLS